MASFLKRYIRRKLDSYFSSVLDQDSKNIERELQKIATKETAEFILGEELLKVNAYNTKFELLSYALSLIEIEGPICEFGVYMGRTINFISSLVKNKIVYGFDSFEGLPETWRFGFEEGTFAVGCLPKVNENVRLIKGWFNDTLPEFIKEFNGPVSFIHIDCDLYSSTKAIFDFLSNKIVPGTIFVFDEFFNYPGWKNGEYKAFSEFIEQYNVRFNYIGFVKYDEQVGVKITHV